MMILSADTEKDMVIMQQQTTDHDNIDFLMRGMSFRQGWSTCCCLLAMQDLVDEQYQSSIHQVTGHMNHTSYLPFDHDTGVSVGAAPIIVETK
jgi:hypothetical protein